MASNSTRLTFRECTEISTMCPVEATVLGYYPNFGANIFFTAGFGLITLASVVIGSWKRTWSYMIAIAGGCLLETVGYAGRVMMHSNPWDKNAFQMQICCLVLAPTLICAGIYLTLKHISLNLNPALSRVRPRLYPLIFLPADASCLVVQAIGGGIAAAAGRTNRKLLEGGNRAIIAGIALQVVVLLGFGAVATDFYLRVRMWMHGPDATPSAVALWNTKRFRMFVYAVTAAFGSVLLRCIYRIAEMAGGWGNHIMQDEVSFMVLDSSLVLISVTLLTVFHPGLFFPQMATGPVAKDGEKTPPTSSSEHGGAKVESVSANESA